MKTWQTSSKGLGCFKMWMERWVWVMWATSSIRIPTLTIVCLFCQRSCLRVRSGMKRCSVISNPKTWLMRMIATNWLSRNRRSSITWAYGFTEPSAYSKTTSTTAWVARRQRQASCCTSKHPWWERRTRSVRPTLFWMSFLPCWNGTRTTRAMWCSS